MNDYDKMSNPKGWKNHYYTAETSRNPHSNKVWYHSACKLVFSGEPSGSMATDRISCLRCRKALGLK